MTEKQINDAILELQENLDKRIPAYTRRVKQALDLARARVTDIILKHEKSGKLPKNRAKAINDELAAVEASLYRELLSQTTIVIEDTARDAGEGLNGVLVTAIGVTALMAMQDEEGTAEALSSAGVLIAIGLGLLALIKSVLSTVLGRSGSDGLNLRDRLRKLAADIIADVQITLRRSNKTGEAIAETQRKVAEVFGDVEWRVARIVDTEASVAYRTAVAKAAEASNLVEGLKIIDFPHGNPGEHEKHECYKMARRDDHGLGKGVYPVSNRKVRNPHPQCRARLVLVMKEGVLNA